jgi:cobalamin biosynthesis protein CobW
MVDAATFLPLSAEHEVLDEQVKGADFLVLNKIDLITERERQEVEQRLRCLNRRALLLEASYGQVPTDLLFSTGVSAYRAQLQPGGPAESAPTAHHAHGQDAIQAFSYETYTLVDLYAFERFLQTLPSNVYRAKGLLQLTRGAFPHVFNYTCGRFDFQPLDPTLARQIPTQAVFIGKDIHTYKDEIIGRFQACERGDEKNT